MRNVVLHIALAIKVLAEDPPTRYTSPFGKPQCLMGTLLKPLPPAAEVEYKIKCCKIDLSSAFKYKRMDARAGSDASKLLCRNTVISRKSK